MLKNIHSETASNKNKKNVSLRPTIAIDRCCRENIGHIKQSLLVKRRYYWGEETHSKSHIARPSAMQKEDSRS